MIEKKRCLECNEMVPYHFGFSSHDGLFCDEKCCEKYEEKSTRLEMNKIGGRTGIMYSDGTEIMVGDTISVVDTTHKQEDLPMYILNIVEGGKATEVWRDDLLRN